MKSAESSVVPRPPHIAGSDLDGQDSGGLTISFCSSAIARSAGEQALTPVPSLWVHLCHFVPILEKTEHILGYPKVLLRPRLF